MYVFCPSGREEETQTKLWEYESTHAGRFTDVIFEQHVTMQLKCFPSPAGPFASQPFSTANSMKKARVCEASGQFTRQKCVCPLPVLS